MTTSDGITTEDWGLVESCADAILRASSTSNEQFLCLVQQLRHLENVYGRLPSILATEGDFTERPADSLSLWKEAYTAACEIGDAKNKTIISATLAEFYVEEVLDRQRAVFWISTLGENLKGYTDDYYDAVYETVKKTLNDPLLEWA